MMLGLADLMLHAKGQKCDWLKSNHGAYVVFFPEANNNDDMARHPVGATLHWKPDPTALAGLLQVSQEPRARRQLQRPLSWCGPATT